MTEYCTCGTGLVEDARFCHRCGRPTRELTPAEAPPPVPEQKPIPAATRVQIPVSFRNPLALRVAFVMSLGIMLVEMIPGLNLLFVVWWLAAGWVAVLIYKRITGTAISVGAGARLGSITGVLTFMSMTVAGALQIAIAGRQPLDEMLKQTPQAAELSRDPVALSLLVLISLAFIFGVVVGTCAAGGALGARFGARSGTGMPGAA